MLKNSFYKIIIIIRSLYSIIKCKIQKIVIGNYFIIQYPHNSLDLRSEFILNNLNLNKSINILRFNEINFKSLLTFLNVPNSVSFSPFEKSDSKKFFQIYVKYLLKFNKIKKFVMIDDYRVISEFCRLFKELKIYSLVYMHGRIPLNIDYLKNSFDTFLVWSSFFKDVLIKNNKKYKDKNIIIIGRDKFKNKNYNFKKSKNNLMLIDEDFINYEDIHPYLNYLVKKIKVKIFLKKKISRQLPISYYNFCIKNKIKIIPKKYNFSESLKKYKISKTLAFSSTALLDSIYYKVMPIKIDHKKDLLKEYKKFKLFFYVYKPADLKKIFNKKNSEVQNILMTNKKKLWSQSNYNNNNVKKALKLIYN